ncbi:ABC transporter ATP-binding protein [Metabacillus dongyingensis]|uniref:ABC transporter ATP-binding protein n=1 Tax=Metabacillus dongyingensis TaxID=2874282 RepID=UPI001CBB63F2|nr:ABC transporter ATP-binding protein [Metabacillus dongyingensis]UAL52529.1 ABC transporter ATP-binding protein [Metabacillus dongyingensis]
MNVNISGLTKVYGKKRALDGITLQLEENKIYGLLGRNGAGKTTLMQILAGQIMPTGGSVLINSQEPFENQEITESICLINESENFKKGLKIKDILKIANYFYPNWNRETAEKLLEDFYLNENMKIKTLSKGMESALGITVGLASRSPITIFDEPYIGLDAAARSKFYDLLLEEYEEYPRTLILSTHLIDEITRLLEEVLIVSEGRLLMQKNTDELREESFVVNGSSAAVSEFVKNKNVVYRKSFGSMEQAVLYGENRMEANEAGLQVEHVPVQDLMVYLTAKPKGGVSA